MEENVWAKKRIILISAFGLLAIVLIFIQIFGGKKNNNDIEIVTSTSKFYTVSNCVYRYITYLQSKDVDSLILLLDNSYKKSNNISKENVLDKLDKLDSTYNFEGRKMYQQEITENTTKYYVYGYLREETINNDGNKQDFYIVVTLNNKDKTFSITPYDGEIFINGGM